MSTMSDDQIIAMKKSAQKEVQEILDTLDNDYPGITEGVASAVGSGVGATAAFGALYGLGVTGLSGAGITSGLATAGGLVGGGMVAGIGVLAAPIVLLGIGGYALAKKRKNAKLSAALATAIQKLYHVQEHLLKNAEHFRDELATIRATIDLLAKKKPA